MYQICVSGAAKGKSVEEGKELAQAVGAALAKAGHSLLSGATIGLPNHAAEGYKKAGGHMSVGLSPATSKVEHVRKYRLPTEAYDAIVYTGLHYVGRDSLLVNSADAVISIGGRLGTLHEFTIAMETETPIAFLQGAGGVSSEIHDVLRAAGIDHTAREELIFAEDPDELVRKLVAVLDKKFKDYKQIYK